MDSNVNAFFLQEEKVPIRSDVKIKHGDFELLAGIVLTGHVIALIRSHWKPAAQIY